MNPFINLLLILLAINLNLAANDAVDVKAITCQDGFIPLGENCYQFNMVQMTWNDAISTCEYLNSDLAHPLDYGENSLIVIQLLSDYQGAGGFWNGASEDSGNWKWEYNQAPVNYFNWGYGMPDNPTVFENDCGVFWEPNNWAWDDQDCSNGNYFICQQRNPAQN